MPIHFFCIQSLLNCVTFFQGNRSSENTYANQTIVNIEETPKALLKFTLCKKLLTLL